MYDMIKLVKIADTRCIFTPFYESVVVVGEGNDCDSCKQEIFLTYFFDMKLFIELGTFYFTLSACYGSTNRPTVCVCQGLWPS